MTFVFIPWKERSIIEFMPLVVVQVFFQHVLTLVVVISKTQSRNICLTTESPVNSFSLDDRPRTVWVASLNFAVNKSLKLSLQTVNISGFTSFGVVFLKNSFPLISA